MKFLLLFFLVGLASAASIYNGHETDKELSISSSLMDVVCLDDFELAAEEEHDKVSELEKKVREKLEKILEKIKGYIDEGKDVEESLVEKFLELKQKLKDLKGKLSDKAKELMEKIKQKLIDDIRKLFDKMDNKAEEKRSIKEGLKGLFEKLKVAIFDKIEPESLKETIEKVFVKLPEVTEMLLEKLKEKGRKTFLDYIDKVLKENDHREERSIGEMWQKVKDWWDQLKIDLKEKYFKFGEWVKEKAGKGLEHMKDKHEKIKEIAKLFKDHIKEVSKDVAAEALEFFRPYKEDLGSLYDQVKEMVKEVLKKKD